MSGQPDTYIMRSSEDWICFHCGEHFTYHQEDEARLHFEPTPSSMPTCLLGGDALIKQLRAAETRVEELEATLREIHHIADHVQDTIEQVRTWEVEGEVAPSDEIRN